jgi:glycosyltransferase involved in cell wall biosynthesis
MRILMLAQFYPPLLGGEEQHVRNLSVQLAARGHHVAVATLRYAGWPPREIDDGVHVYRLQGTTQRARWLFKQADRTHAPPFPDPEALWGLRQVIELEQPDIVHAHNWLVHSFLPLKRWSNAPLVVTLHDYSLRCVKQSLMYGEGIVCRGPAPSKCLDCAARNYGLLKGVPTLIASRLSGSIERRAVNAFLPVSRSVAALNALGETGLPFEIIPNFVPDELDQGQEGCEEYLSQLPGQDFLLFVGDLSPDKGVDVLLRAYAGLSERPPLVLIGRRVAKTPSHFPDGVSVFHDWPHEAVVGAWFRSMFGVVPSTCPDACPTVTLEAMASGRAVVGSRIGGLIDQIADGESGYLVPPGDAAALQNALQQLIADPELRRRMGEAGRGRVREFQAASVVPRVERVYRQLCPKE